MNPKISEFFWIEIYMYFNDHNPPHFHVKYWEYDCYIWIKSLELIEWNLPSKVEKMVLAWAELYQDKLEQEWKLVQDHKQPTKINPLSK